MTQAAQAQTRPPFPQVGEAFSLTASEEVTGIGLVSAFGYNPEGWRSSAATVPAGTTGSFKLVAVGYQPDLAAVARACKAQIQSGCWMKVFNDTFGSNGVNPVGVPDPSWVNPDGNAVFPIVFSSGHRYFRWAGRERRDYGLWLVAVGK